MAIEILKPDGCRSDPLSGAQAAGAEVSLFTAAEFGTDKMDEFEPMFLSCEAKLRGGSFSKRIDRKCAVYDVKRGCSDVVTGTGKGGRRLYDQMDVQRSMDFSVSCFGWKRNRIQIYIKQNRRSAEKWFLPGPPVFLFFQQFISFCHMFLDSLKAFCAHHMLNPAGVFRRGFFIDSQIHQPVGKHCMAFIHGLSNLFSRIGQGDIAILIHQNITIFAEVAHGDADTRLGEIQFIGDIDGTDVRFFIAKNQYGFKIVFG